MERDFETEESCDGEAQFPARLKERDWAAE